VVSINQAEKKDNLKKKREKKRREIGEEI